MRAFIFACGVSDFVHACTEIVIICFLQTFVKIIRARMAALAADVSAATSVSVCPYSQASTVKQVRPYASALSSIPDKLIARAIVRIKIIVTVE